MHEYASLTCKGAVRFTRPHSATGASLAPYTRMCLDCSPRLRRKRRTICLPPPRRRGCRAAQSCGGTFPTSGAPPRSAPRNLRRNASTCHSAGIMHASTMAKRGVRTQRVAALSTTDHIDVRASQLIRRGLGEQWRWGRMTRDLRALVATFEVLEEPVLGREALAANLARVRRRRRCRARRRHTKAEQARVRLGS